MKKIKDIMFFPNGNTAVFDKNGEQIGELQRSWLLLYVDFLIEQGIEPDGLVVELPHGKARIFKIEEGYNWEFVR